MRFSFVLTAALFASTSGNADATCAGTIGAGASYSTTSNDVTLSEGCVMGDGIVEEDMGGMTLYSITTSACPGCIVTDSSGGETFIEPAADLGCDMSEVNAANPCVTSSSTTTTTETSSTNDMADMADMSNISDQMPPTTTASCPESSEARCYCASATGSINPNCDPTQRITYTAAETDTECADYCFSECGQGAGSDFSCHNENSPLTPCNKKTTSCECSSGCETEATPQQPMQFAGQCGAFCDAHCGSDYSGGYAYGCPGDTSAASPKIGAAVGSTIVAIAMASLVM